MGRLFVGLRARLVGFAVVVGCVHCALGASAASAREYKLLKEKAHVALACGNPKNHRLSTIRFNVRPFEHRSLAHLKARIRAAARVKVGADLGCFGIAVAHGKLAGPELESSPVGLGPSQIRSAYKLTGLHSDGRRVAIVDAYNDPSAESDLDTFRKMYGLPSWTTANGCFKRVNQAGASSPMPGNDYGWSVEISLDLDAVSSACPDCHILLVEANSASTADLDAAEDTAATASGVAAVSNSWGGAEDSTVLSDDTNFRHHGVEITASAGDNGYGVEWPALSRYVTAVGGTLLTSAAKSRGWAEKAWADGGSGCSAYEPKPAWQKDTGCPRRTVADVSADADPASGLGIYDTANNCGSSTLCDRLIELGLVPGLNGWAQVGGTSLSSPLIASVYALAGNTGSLTDGSFPYGHTASLFDVTSGSNGTCSPSYLCTARPGYDGPTGLGTPNGVGAF